jgi:peptidoglycan/xylan/chitin deacetylase (PgdA/CDA1 family)
MNKLRFAAKSLIHGAIDWSGRPHQRRQQLRGSLIILTYHSFCTDWPRGLFNSLPIDRFERQLRFLRENFTLVSLEQGLTYLQQGQSDDRPWVAITIDDGFQDNYTHAWPVLQQHSVPATIFLATDFIDTGRPPWPTQLVEVLERTQLQKIEAPFKATLDSLAARSAVARQIKKEWSPLPPMERFEKLKELREHLRVDEAPNNFPLTWAQVHEMQSGGIRFGSHTVYHSILSEVDQTVVAQELRDSKHRIEAELQEPCALFAYPDGKHNGLSKAALGLCGYQAAVTQDPGCNNNTNEWLELKRIEIPFNDPIPSFRCRTSLALTSNRRIENGS